MTLFKYFKADRAIEVLQNSELYLVYARQCNDPFEFSANADISNASVDELKKVLIREDHFRLWCSQIHPQDNVELWREYYFNNLDVIAADRMKVLPRYAQLASNMVIRTAFDKHFVVGCFSKKNDSILMWSHYAAQHSGLVIEFDMEQYPFKKISEWLRDIKYIKEKPRYKHNYDDSYVGFFDQFYTIGSTKWEEWKYEDEVRLLLPNQNVSDIHDEHYLRIDPKSIRSVIFGFLCEDAVRSKVEQILSFQYMSHVQKFRAIMNQDQYKVDIVPATKED